MLDSDATIAVSAIHARGIQYRGYAPCTWKLMRYTIDMVASKRVLLTSVVSHKLDGLDKVAEAFEINRNKEKYGATHPAQVIVSQ